MRLSESVLRTILVPMTMIFWGGRQTLCLNSLMSLIRCPILQINRTSQSRSIMSRRPRDESSAPRNQRRTFDLRKRLARIAEDASRITQPRLEWADASTHAQLGMHPWMKLTATSCCGYQTQSW
jgi:hypothetical protein